MKTQDIYTRAWIIENALEEIENYEKGILTLRGLHYRLVSRGMTNTIQHYKRVVSAMIKARKDGIVDYDVFADHDRSMESETEWEYTDLLESIETGKRQVKAWINSYYKRKWENQPYYPEVLIEKKALIGVFGSVCDEWAVALGACKGYPSLTFLNQIHYRFRKAKKEGKIPVILYFGDYDPSGEDIPRSMQKNLQVEFGIKVELIRVALKEEQVLEWNLPPAPTKKGDSRTAKWEGLGQVELDAVEPKKIQSLCSEAISDLFDKELENELLEEEEIERETYVKDLKEFVKTL